MAQAVAITDGPNSLLDSSIVSPAGEAQLFVAADDGSGESLTYAWTASCDGLTGDGGFDDSGSAVPIWTAPDEQPVNCTLSVVVSNDSGSSASASLSLLVSLIINNVPLLSVSVTSDQTVATSAGAVVLTATASGARSIGFTLTYGWTASCTNLGSSGVFDDSSADMPTWFAPANASGDEQFCFILVQVVSGSGRDAVEAQRRILQRVAAAPTVDPASPLAAAVLPSSRSGRVGVAASAFATLINTGASTANDCSIAPATSIPASFVYQTTDPVSNEPVGQQNAPADIPPGAFQTFLFAFTPLAAFAPVEAELLFDCADTGAAASRPGLNSLLVSASTDAVPDIVSAVATTEPGTVAVPGIGGTGAFAVATVNLGSTAVITVSGDTGGASLPIGISICQSNPTDGSCLGTPSGAVSTQIGANATPSFVVFVRADGAVGFDPAGNRVFVRFTDTAGIVRGSTSVAVRTN